MTRRENTLLGHEDTTLCSGQVHAHRGVNVSTCSLQFTAAIWQPIEAKLFGATDPLLGAFAGNAEARAQFRDGRIAAFGE